MSEFFCLWFLNSDFLCIPIGFVCRLNITRVFLPLEIVKYPGLPGKLQACVTLIVLSFSHLFEAPQEAKN
jgi:hypothetical protein